MVLDPRPQVRGVHPQGGRPDGGLQDDGPAGHRAEGARGPRRAGPSGGTFCKLVIRPGNKFQYCCKNEDTNRIRFSSLRNNNTVIIGYCHYLGTILEV